MNRIATLCLSLCVVLMTESIIAFGMNIQDEVADYCSIATEIGISSVATAAPAIAKSTVALGIRDDDERRPAEHRCPITTDVMTDPVVAADGHSYEKAAILQHFKVNGATSPFTGASLKNKDLLDNHALKVMIDEWKAGKQSDPCELDTRDAKSIAERVKEEFRRNADLLNLEKGAKGQHIVAFLGNTGAGKSTLVNLLAGKKLKISPDEEDYILDDSDDQTAMVIGLGGGSETLYPKSIDVDGLRFFDLPGFNDTDGSERNLVNAAFIRRILLDAESVRFVYVVGQDQFTADRSTSVKQLFNSLQQLFVVDQEMDLIENSIFVATKVTCAPDADIINFLLKKTNSNDKLDLNQHLQSWYQNQKLFRMFHPLRERNNLNIRAEILSHIVNTKSTKIRGINVSVLYPPETKSSLERMFLTVMEETFKRNILTPLTTLSDYDKATLAYSDETFWQTFNEELCRNEDVIGLLKDFCINPYAKALRNLEKENEANRQIHIQNLKKKRQERVKDIKIKTETKVKDIISSFVPQKDKNDNVEDDERDDFIFFDFAYHKDYYDHVCGSNEINQLTTDLTEQEIIRQHYANFISRHSHDQMMCWYQNFSGVIGLNSKIDKLTKQITLMDEELKRLKTSDIKCIEIIEIPIESVIPQIPHGYEEVYKRFLKGKLIYRPQEGSDIGVIELPVAALKNPLEGTFDLSQCENADKHLRISTGYKKTMKNECKFEIWFAPRFLIEKELHTSAKDFLEIYKQWKTSEPVGIFWTWSAFETNATFRYHFMPIKGDIRSMWEKASVKGIGAGKWTHTDKEEIMAKFTFVF